LISIDKYFKIHYNYLLTVANNILGVIHKNEYKSTLVNDCYLYMKSKEAEIIDENTTENRLKSIAINWMYKQVHWNKTDFKKTWLINDNPEVSYDIYEIEPEDTMESEIDYQKKIDHINKKVDNMSLDQKILFELFKSGINNSNKLAKHTGLSRTGCYNILKKFKKDLKDGYEM
jgi:hypothetical protein